MNSIPKRIFAGLLSFFLMIHSCVVCQAAGFYVDDATMKTGTTYWNLSPKQYYSFFVVQEVVDAASDIPAESILYMDQATADSYGRVSFVYQLECDVSAQTILRGKNGETAKEITWLYAQNGTLTVYATDEIPGFADAPWGSVESDISRLVITSSVIAIRSGAFNGCDNLAAIVFEGDAPDLDPEAFAGITATVYYPGDNATWTDALLQDYCGNLTWVAQYPGHEHSYQIVLTEPTCTEQGFTTYTCACGDSYVTDYVDALGHNWDEGVVEVEPTEETGGLMRYTCLRCKETMTATIPVLGHSHRYETSITVPTCTEQGYTTYICSCGVSYVSDYVDALGHDLGEWVTSIYPTCTEDGTDVRSCSRCDYMEERIIGAMGHHYETVVTAPTCTEQGYTTYTCACGDSYVSDYMEALGHNMGQWTVVTVPTCIQDGSECRDCSRCDHYETRTVAATGHDYVSEVTAPTCMDRGYTTYSCHCGDSYVGDDVDALGHDFTDWVVVQKPSEDEEGLEERSCTRCEQREQRVLAKMENPFTDIPEGAFYHAPVLWAVENGITNGATPTTFNPGGSCLRAHVVTFLHRAAGDSEPTSATNPFSDVKSADFFYKPVLWAVEKGITNGVSATAFGSYANCNRAAVVTFLWRAAGSPEPKATQNPFVDVKTTDFFYKPVLWAVENGITNGVDATHFGPTTDCNRAQVVTFLYRSYK